MGVQEMALMLLGIGILSERFGGGRGLQELGTGIQSLVAAPLTGTGTGLTSLAGGIKSIAETFGDLGRGLSALLGALPSLPPPREGPPSHGSANGNGGNGLMPPLISLIAPPLTTDSGGSSKTLLSGGGGSVPGASFSFDIPASFILERYAVTPGVHPGLQVPGYWVSNTPLQDKPAGGSTLI